MNDRMESGQVELKGEKQDGGKDEDVRSHEG